MNHVTIKMRSLTTTKQEEFKFIVNCFFENNQNDNEQNETFNILNATFNALSGNESQSNVVVSGQELSTVLNETIVTNISTVTSLTENNTEQYSPTNENNNLNITTNNIQVLGQTNNTALATITTLEEVTRSKQQRVNRPRQTKTKFTPYHITITLRNRNTCTIPVTTFLSSAS